MSETHDNANSLDEGDLRKAAEARERDLALAAELRRGDDTARALATLRAALAERPPAAPRSSRRRSLFLAAAAAAVLGGFALWRTLEPEVDPWDRPDRLGAAVERIEPLDAPLPEFGRFAWRLPRGVEASLVEVLTPGGTLLATSPRGTATTWTPSDTSGWPRTIVWRVRVFDPSGEQPVSPSWSASRQP